MPYSFHYNILKEAVLKANILYLNSLPRDKDIAGKFFNYSIL